MTKWEGYKSIPDRGAPREKGTKGSRGNGNKIMYTYILKIAISIGADEFYGDLVFPSRSSE